MISSQALPISFHDTDAAAERRAMRRAVSRLSLSNNERVVLQYLVNVWFIHRGKGAVHPGREAIARKTNVSVRTVQTYLGKFRDLGFIRAIDYAKGGRRATRYSVDLSAIHNTAFPPVKAAPGHLVPVPTGRANSTDFEPKPSKICSRYLKREKAAPIPMREKKARKGKAEVIRPSQFSIWRGTAREAFLGWALGQEGLSPSQKLILHAIAQNLCPDDGWTYASNRFLAKATGLTRRETDRAVNGLLSDKTLGEKVETRSRRRLFLGSRASEVLAAAPGMPF